MKRFFFIALSLSLGAIVTTHGEFARAQQTPAPEKTQAQPTTPPPFTPPESVIMEADVEYGRAGDRSLKLDLMRPKDQGDKVLPVVVAIHGGGWRAGSKESFRRGIALYVATGNYVGVTVGYRLTDEAIWPAQIHDCKAAIRWLRANADRYKIDPNRMGAFGGSAGGHLVALLGTSGDVKELEGDNGNPGYSSSVQCVADFCGPANFLKFLDQPGSGGRSAVIKLFGGPPAEHEAAAREASPVTWVSKDDPPFLIAHGTADPVVPLAQSEELAEMLEKAGVPVTFVRLEGGAHSIGGQEITQRQRDFFELHLRGQKIEVSAAPIKVVPPKD